MAQGMSQVVLDRTHWPDSALDGQNEKRHDTRHEKINRQVCN